MDQVQTLEGEFTVPIDGKKLYTKTWKPTSNPKAIVIFIHGFSDHCNAYGDFFPFLATQGIEVRSFDQRGWGRSALKPADKGLTGDTSRVLSDITEFVKKSLPASAPVFLMGHSMGGGEVLCWMSSPETTEVRKSIRGYLLEAPFISFPPASKPSAVVVAIGRLAGRFLPHRQMLNKLDEKLLSRDPEVQKAFVEDVLCHQTGTLEGLAAMLDRTGALHAGKVKISPDAGEGGKTRIWFGHGSEDGVCDYKGTAELYQRLSDIQDKEFKTYDGWYHQLHAEPTPYRETYAGDVSSWILARSGPLELVDSK